MSRDVTLDGQTYSIPTQGDTDWAADFVAWAQAVSDRAEEGGAAAVDVNDGAVRVAPSAGVLEIDPSVAGTHIVTMEDDINTFTLANLSALADDRGKRITIIFLQQGEPPKAFNATPANVLFAGGAFALTNAGTGVDVLTLVYDYFSEKWLEVSRSMAQAAL